MVSKGNHPQMALIQVSELLYFTQMDEYDEHEVVDLVEKHRVVMIKAKFAGAGKSTICKNMERLKG